MARKKKEFPPLRSGLERTVKDQLDKLGVKYEYEPRKIEYRRRVVSGICGKCGHYIVYQKKHYLPDFILENGVVLEVKGRLTASDRAKLLAVREQHPDIDLRLLFGANNKINKNKQERYMDWAARHGIMASVLIVPASWTR